MKLVELHTKADRLTGSYYLGYLVYQNEDLTVLIGLDDDANASGLILVNNQDLVGMVEQSPSLAYCQRLIDEGKSTDPFQLMPVNQELLKGGLSNFFEAGKAALFKKLPVNVTLNNGVVYSGIVTETTLEELRIRQIDGNFALDRIHSVIPMKQISSLEINSALGKMWSEYQDSDIAGNPYDLVELYLDWLDDDRFGNYLLGRVLLEDDHYLLFESINDYGQLEAICLVNRDDIIHECTASPVIDFYSFLLTRNQEAGIFDLNQLDHLAQSLDHVPSPLEVLQNAGQQLVSVDDYAAPGEMTGYIQALTDSEVYIADPVTGQVAPFAIDRICTIDLASSELEKMKEYLAAQE